MSATFELHLSELTPEFISSLNAISRSKIIKIELRDELGDDESDEMSATEYLFGNETMRTILEQRMEDVEAGRNLVMPPQEEFE